MLTICGGNATFRNTLFGSANVIHKRHIMYIRKSNKSMLKGVVHQCLKSCNLYVYVCHTKRKYKIKRKMQQSAKDFVKYCMRRCITIANILLSRTSYGNALYSHWDLYILSRPSLCLAHHSHLLPKMVFMTAKWE